jgi:hypothetical protein
MLFDFIITFNYFDFYKIMHLYYVKKRIKHSD